jgi:hypothetical protein
MMITEDEGQLCVLHLIVDTADFAFLIPSHHIKPHAFNIILSLISPSIVRICAGGYGYTPLSQQTHRHTTTSAAVATAPRPITASPTAHSIRSVPPHYDPIHDQEEEVEEVEEGGNRMDIEVEEGRYYLNDDIETQQQRAANRTAIAAFLKDVKIGLLPVEMALLVTDTIRTLL